MVKIRPRHLSFQLAKRHKAKASSCGLDIPRRVPASSRAPHPQAHYPRAVPRIRTSGSPPPAAGSFLASGGGSTRGRWRGTAGSCSSSSLSDGVFQVTAGSTGRSLLQAKKDCPVSFEFQNYTIITSKCKGPKFPASQCCAALKEFACPFYMYLNDDSNSCASTMFTYINLNGKYPPGLFSSECKEGKLGLSCENVPQRDISTANGGERAQRSFLAWIVLSVAVASLFH
ncbi:GPI-anchored protein LLG1-like [Panicum virgatum]|uniref:GPI-anchored protein LLG1-like n=1 Tax=Panicum virgatum TaxID=38727 RepID=UPI0019D524F5|nr:GPI-anchored protein LLG1-like [Panicum virgatum]